MATRLLKTLIQDSYDAPTITFGRTAAQRQFARLAIQMCSDEQIGFEEYINLHKKFLTKESIHKENIQVQLHLVQNLKSYFD